MGRQARGLNENYGHELMELHTLGATGARHRAQHPHLRRAGRADKGVVRQYIARMTYANMSGNPTFSHLHFGQFNVAGGVMIFLCGGGGQPDCPASTSATFSGTITPANVTGPAAQGISAGDLASALEAVLEGESYANIHSAKFPAGELRGQVRRGASRARGQLTNASHPSLESKGRTNSPKCARTVG